MSNLRIVICNRYQLYSLISHSSTHSFYTGFNLHSSQKLFIKSQSRRQKSLHQLSIAKQSKLYQSLQGGPGIPSLFWCGQDGDYNFLILQQLSKQNIEQLLQKSHRKFSLKTIIQIALSVLETLIYLHLKGVVHNNVSPKHIVPGRGENVHDLYLVDYSETSVWRNKKTGQHGERREREFTEVDMGFASVGRHEGYGGSRRDDLESWMYVVVYLWRGELSWIRKGNEGDRMDMLIKKKEAVDSGLFMRDLPIEIQAMCKYILSLEFSSDPDYSYIKSLLVKLAHKQYIVLDNVYDWMITEGKRSQMGANDDLLINAEIMPKEREFVEEQYEIYKRELEERTNMSHLLSETIHGEFEHMELGWIEPETVAERNDEEDGGGKGKKDCLLF